MLYNDHAGGNWLHIAEGDSERYIDLGKLTSARFSNVPVTMPSKTRQAELVVDGQVITLEGGAAEAAEMAIRSIMGS